MVLVPERGPAVYLSTHLGGSMACMLGADKTHLVKQIATDMGFDRVGIAPAGPISRPDNLDRWLASGRAGSMDYLHRNRELRRDPSRLIDGAKSFIVVAMNYHQDPPPDSDVGGGGGRVAMYAWGDDYHEIVKDRLRAFVDAIESAIDEPFHSRTCVDTVPIVERELAAMAGVGWIGKNTLVMHESLGSYFFLGEVVTTLELVADPPAADHCGTCTRCLDACPTGAFPAPYEMDASRCISYLTIEHRGEIDDALQPKMGDWVFGCDVCQQVCPHNRDAPRSTSFPVRPPGPTVSLDEMTNWSPQEYARVLKGSAMKRAKPEMLRRNARIARNNSK